MPFVDLYPHGVETLRTESEARQADTAIYRLVLRRLAIAGLPDLLTVGDVSICFTRGPIHTQVTSVRQRPGWPLVFDKHMRRAVPVGNNELLTVCELRAPMPAPMPTALLALRKYLAIEIDGWRTRAEAALGVLSATLDERVALEPVAEDVILLANDEPCGAVDRRELIRPFMPFDVTESDRGALTSLAKLDSDGASAATLLWAGMRQGPTSTGFLSLWKAIDLMTTRKGVKPKYAVAEALAAAGADRWHLTLSVDDLVRVRNPCAHGGTVDPEQLNVAFTECEAIARLLVRRTLGLRSGWPAWESLFVIIPPEAPDPAGQPLWNFHEDGLPPPIEHPEPLGWPRADVFAGEGRVVVRGAPTPTVADRIRWLAMVAVNAAAVDIAPFVIQVTCDRDSSLVSPSGILLGQGLASQIEELDIGLNHGQLVVDRPEAPARLCELVAQMQVTRTGITSADFSGLAGVDCGALLVSLGGSFLAYKEWVIKMKMRAELLQPSVNLDVASLDEVGATVGMALAGDQERRAALAAWVSDGSATPPDLRMFVSGLLTFDEFTDFRDYLQFFSDCAGKTFSLGPPLDAANRTTAPTSAAREGRQRGR